MSFCAFIIVFLFGGCKKWQDKGGAAEAEEKDNSDHDAFDSDVEIANPMNEPEQAQVIATPVATVAVATPVSGNGDVS